MKHDENSAHRSLLRGLFLLEAVGAAGGGLSLAEATRASGLHRSTVHHLLQSLLRAGYLRQDENTRTYWPGSRLLGLGRRRFSPGELGAAGRPFLAALTRATGEGSSLAAWVDRRIVIVCKQDTDGPVRVVQEINANRPIHCTAVGKALAAWLPAAEVAAALARAPMTAMTPKTITTPEAFAAELRRIRRAGYAIDDEEQFDGLRCVAMPIFAAHGDIVASMCVVGPRQRMTQQKMQQVRGRLAEQAASLSRHLGHEGQPGGGRSEARQGRA